MTTPDGARDFLRLPVHDGPVTMPPKTNANAVDRDTQIALRKQVALTVQQLKFDPVSLAQAYIAKGRALSEPTLASARLRAAG